MSRKETFIEGWTRVIKSMPQRRDVIVLTPAEIQTGLDRVKFAEHLIRQLPEDHEGRNTWLSFYGSDA